MILAMPSVGATTRLQCLADSDAATELDLTDGVKTVDEFGVASLGPTVRELALPASAFRGQWTDAVDGRDLGSVGRGSHVGENLFAPVA
jgi:hypothetical protein